MQLGLLTSKAQEMHWIYSTETKPWTEGPQISPAPEPATADITIFPEQALQTIDGFGGSFNERGWDALITLPAEKQNEIMQALFSSEGAHFSLCRMPIGASDYALSYYSLNDVADDFSMRNFNIDRDRYILIPYIKAAMKVNPALRIWASPWTPPAWMKINEHYTLKSGGRKGGSSTNEMDPRKNILNNSTAFKMQDAYLKAYALYFSKFIQAYAAEGIQISAVHPQNEIAHAPYWPACTWRPEDLAVFIGKYLGPRFEKDGIETPIWLGTINWGDPDYVRTVLNDRGAAKYIQGIGFQWAGKNAIGTIHKEYPEMLLMQTESECGDGENDWAAAEHTWSLMHRYFTNGAHSYMNWNMVLDHTGMSSWGWPQNMLISINTETGAIRYNPEYYLYKHISKFVRPGARRLQTTQNKDHLAFMNPDGQLVLLLVNTEAADRVCTVAIGDKRFRIEAKAKSINTLLVK
jgi:glucosylceramidase